MATGLGLLKLSPQAFWSMTPREFERAASVVLASRQAPMRGRELADLIRRFPDDGGTP